MQAPDWPFGTKLLVCLQKCFYLDWEAGLFEVKGGQFVCKTKAPFHFIPREGEEGRETRGGRRMLLYIGRERKRCESRRGTCHRWEGEAHVLCPS